MIPATPAPQSQTSPQNRGRRRLLIVDDNVDISMVMRDIALTAGFDVSLAHDGQSFRAAYVQLVPSHIILDLALPDCDGLDLARFLGTGRCRSAIIVASSHDERFLRLIPPLLKEVFRLDLRGVLHKPFSARDLLALLEPGEALPEGRCG